MAKMVLGMGTSHSPGVTAVPETWLLFGQDSDPRNPNLYDLEGNHVTFEELLSRADPALVHEVTPEKGQERFEANQRGVAQLSEVMARVNPDALVVLSNDLSDIYDMGSQRVPLTFYCGEMVPVVPQYREGHPYMTSSSWAYGEEERTLPCATELGRHVVQVLMEEGVDAAHATALKPGAGVGHGFAFVLRRILENKPVPTVPLYMDTTYHSPLRSYEIGRALRTAIERWPANARVGVVATGGLSHFVVDQEIDRMSLKAMQDRDVRAIAALPRARLQAGSAEIRMWLVAAGASEHLDMQVHEYVPCYRSVAGTGVGMSFASWTDH